MYIKVLNDETVLDVMNEIIYVKYQEKNQTLVTCPKEEANGIISSDASHIWHLEELKEFPISGFDTVSIQEIYEDEYNELKRLLDNKKEDEPVKDNYIGNDVTLSFMKEYKTTEMSETCNAVIVNGFDIRLSDKKTYHFDMTLEDQMNISSLEAQVRAGATQVPYHAKGELCRMYSAEDITAIITKGADFKTYHVTYFNSLKNYISALDSKEAVRDIYYGVSIPDEYKSDVLKAIEK